MKQRRIFYDFRYVENPVPYYTRKGWLRYKDKILNVNRYNFVNIDGFGIKLQPKRRHKRSIKARDYGRLFNCTKFYFDPFLNEKETMDYFEELERLREIEGYKE